MNNNELEEAAKTDDFIAKHLEKIKRVRAQIKEETIKEGDLMARVFIRKTGALPDHNGNYIINEQDLFGWFRNGDYLRDFTEYDTI